MKFTKMHGCGNDYVYVNLFEEKINDLHLVSQLISDRHYGIGSDGLISIGPSDIADFKMNIYNADGSEAEMCGNGIRCVGKYVYDNGLTNKKEVLVETLAGIKKLVLKLSGNEVDTVEVDMGVPLLEASQIPTTINKKNVINELVEIGDEKFNVTCVSMGNPHTVLFVDDLENLNIEKYGKMIERSEIFPNRTNVEFVQIISNDEIIMRVWERGSDETLACGTGACASVIACILNEKTDKQVLVHLKGGDLRIRYDDNKHVFMEGDAKKVYVGEIELL